jgi:hypothetical protein
MCLQLVFRGVAACALAWLPLLAPGVCAAYDEAKHPDDPAPLIEAYEPNLLGYTWQDDDVGFIDATVSLKYHLFADHIRDWTCPGDDNESALCSNRWRAYLAFTGKFGFYYGTRDSDPVLAKAYVPKLLIRYTPDSARAGGSFWRRQDRPVYEDWSYLDFAYAHESNGQSIDTAPAYDLERRMNRDNPQFALDKVSRGWDYVQVAAKYSFFRTPPSDPTAEPWQRLAAYVDIRYFLNDGLLQGHPEQYHSFEDDRDAKPREAVAGVLSAVEYEWRKDLLPFWPRILENPRVQVQLETGYDPLFKYNTIRFEVGAKLMELPIALWYEDGYDSSLARYYKRTRAVGIGLRLAQ